MLSAENSGYLDPETDPTMVPLADPNADPQERSETIAEPSVPETPLTPELSLEHPDLYKDHLVHILSRFSESGAAVLVRADTDIPAMVLDPTSYMARAFSNGRVRLGTLPTDPELKKRIMFQGEEFGYEQEIAYRLLHESTHTLWENVSRTPEGLGMTAIMRQYRTWQEMNHGLTALGSLGHYDDVFKKYKEDATELMTMYYWDPKYLERYAVYLTDPTYRDAREARGIATLTQANDFLSAVKSVAELALHNEATVESTEDNHTS